MRRVSPSWLAVVLAGAALFVSLGGPAWAAGVLIGTKQLKRGAVTSRKIRNGNVRNRDLARKAVGARKIRTAAVTNTKLADAAVSTGKLAEQAVTTGKLADQAVTTGKLAGDAVTSAKVADGTLTADDVAPNTFLPFNGTAQNANAVGGVTADRIAKGSGLRVVVPQNTPAQRLAVVPTGFLVASCPLRRPVVAYSNASTPVEYSELDVNAPSTVHFGTLNNIGPNSSDAVIANAIGGSITVTQQVAAKSDSRVSTMWTTGHVEGNSCIFTAQVVSNRG